MQPTMAKKAFSFQNRGDYSKWKIDHYSGKDDKCSSMLRLTTDFEASNGTYPSEHLKDNNWTVVKLVSGLLK